MPEMIRTRIAMIVALFATAAVALAACKNGSGVVDTGKVGLAALNFTNGTAKDNNAPAGTGDFFTGPRNDPAAMKWVQLTSGSANGLNPIVHDGAGFTLYRFDKDVASPSESNCDAACATWPPVLVRPGSRIFVNGVPASKIGVLRRTDGTRQVTIGGWPVYRFSKDTGPGQTNGEGVGGTWFAVSPQGQKVLPPVAPTSPPSAPSGSTVTLGNGSVIPDSGKNFTEPTGSVGVAGPGCQTLGSPFMALSLQLAGGPIKIWTGPNCTGHLGRGDRGRRGPFQDRLQPEDRLDPVRRLTNS
jgi:predicted lipoprotein with Yx(FWY)xxD motif